MKKSVSILLAAVVLFLCASCTTTKAFVEDSDDYVSTPITTKLFSNNLYCGDYVLKFSGVTNNINQITVLGLGVKRGSMYQKGTLYKNNVPVCSVNMVREFDGIVAEGANSTTSFGEQTCTFEITSGTKKYIYDVNIDYSDSEIFTVEQPYDITLETIDQCISSKGKVSQTIWHSPVGAKLYAFGEMYGAVDFISNTREIRTNPHFPVTLSEEEENFAWALMLMEYKFATSFINEDTDTGFHLNFF